MALVTLPEPLQPIELQRLLPRAQRGTGNLQQDCELSIAVRLTDMIDVQDLPRFVTTWTATAPDAVRTRRTNSETIPEGFHDQSLVTRSGPPLRKAPGQQHEHDSRTPLVRSQVQAACFGHSRTAVSVRSKSFAI
jgi:hypothetical protein